MNKLLEPGEKNAVFSSMYTFLLEKRRTKILRDFQGRIEGKLGFAVGKDSELLECLSHHVHRLRERGVLAELQFRWGEIFKASLCF